MSNDTRVFIDSNILLYLLSDDQRKANIAESLLSAESVDRVISTQVINEFVNVARKKARLGWDEIRNIIETFREACQLVPLTAEDQDVAIDITEDFRLQWYDSLMIASALKAEAPVLLSEDMHDGLSIDGTRISNPFG